MTNTNENEMLNNTSPPEVTMKSYFTTKALLSNGLTVETTTPLITDNIPSGISAERFVRSHADTLWTRRHFDYNFPAIELTVSLNGKEVASYRQQ